MMKKAIILSCLAVFLLTGCRGYRSEKEPFHPNPNMDWQPKYKAQQLSLTPPQGTVVWGTQSTDENGEDRATFLQSDSKFYNGKEYGVYVRKAPISVTEETLRRGMERYDIYCAACHDKAGTGKGEVVKRGLVPPPNFSDARILKFRDGELYDVITNGRRTMPAYKKQISAEDRWAIVTYVRALQRSRTATIKDISKEKLGELR